MTLVVDDHRHFKQFSAISWLLVFFWERKIRARIHVSGVKIVIRIQQIYFIFECSFPTCFHWKFNAILHSKVNDSCVMFSIEDVNEWIRLWLYWHFTLRFLVPEMYVSFDIFYLYSLIACSLCISQGLFRNVLWQRCLIFASEICPRDCLRNGIGTMTVFIIISLFQRDQLLNSSMSAVFPLFLEKYHLGCYCC